MFSRHLPPCSDAVVVVDRTRLHTPEPTPTTDPIPPKPVPPVGPDVIPPAIDDPGPLEHPVPIGEPSAPPPPARAASTESAASGRLGSLRVSTRRASGRRPQSH